MATDNTKTCISFTAATDLSAWQHKPVKVAGNGTVEAADADNDPSMGILQNDPTAGQAAIVCVAGISKAVFGATLAAGAIVENQATSGELIANTTGGYAIGIVIRGAGDGETGSILVIPSCEATA